MAIAKEIIRIGNTVVALPGGYVSNEAVQRYGWDKFVDKGPDTTLADESKDAAAPKGAPQKGA